MCITISLQHSYNTYYADQKFLNKCIALEGTIQQINHADLIKKQTTIFIKLHTICYKNKSYQTSKTVTVFCPTTTTQHINLNQTIIIRNALLTQPQSKSDYELYLVKEGIWATAHCNGNSIHIVQEQPLTYFQKIQQSLQQRVHAFSCILFQPLFLGIKEKNQANLLQQHRSTYWGISHHMARSGAHLAILFALLMLILHYTQLSYSIRYFFCITILLSYASISNASISFLRALIMILLHIMCKVFYKVPSTLHILTLTTLITLLYNPAQLFFLDFQLSFGITYIIVWLFTLKRR